MKWTISCLCCFLLIGCNQKQQSKANEDAIEPSIKIHQNTLKLIQSKGKSIIERIKVPGDFTRQKVELNSFANFLRNLPLKHHGSKVKHYDGTKKPNNAIYEAVIDLPIGNKDLHQCADAIMRLKAEYLWETGKYDDIHFNFTNGFRVEYSKWMEGNRMIVDGNKTYWKPGAQRTNNYHNFWKYMELIFTYAGTASLEKELKPMDLSEMQIGDVFIKGGHPGHAVIVLDMAENAKGEQLFMLGQSYMPAQEIQILKNNQTKHISPWYRLDNFEVLNTPEWSFTSDQLKRFEK